MIILFLIIGLHVLLLSKIVFFPYPELFIYPYLTKIGLVPYKQILDQHFPGLMFFPINLATLGIDTPQEMRFVQFILVALSQIFLYLVSKKLIKSSKLVLLPNLLYLIWQPYFEGYVFWIESFVAPLLLLVFYFTLKFDAERKKKTAFMIGLVLGLTTLFKQVIIPFILLYAIYLWLKHKKINYLEMLALGLSIPAFYLIYFIFSKGILADFVYWTATFNFTVFAQMGRKFFNLSELLRALPLFATPFFVLGYLFKRYKKGFVKNHYDWLALFFVGSLIFAYARQDYVHLQPALVFAVLIVGRLVSEQSKKIQKTLLLGILVISLLYLPSYRGLLGDRVLFYSDNEKKVADAVMRYAGKGDSVFAFGTLPHIYQMTETVPSGKLFVFQFHWFMEVAQQRILDGLKTDLPKVVVMDESASVAGVNLTTYASNIKEFVQKYYHTVDSVGNVKVMVLN